ncbi:MAG: hypothetical protein JWO80_5716 [Bryobacterales bacterium]|nr:hypothetical protein [Bryobacterales bacterium]
MKIDHRRVAIAAFSSELMGCARAPSVDILGSFFPVWMVCLSVAVIFTFFARSLVVRCKLESHVGPVALFYPSAVVLFTCALWLIFYR